MENIHIDTAHLDPEGKAFAAGPPSHAPNHNGNVWGKIDKIIGTISYVCDWIKLMKKRQPSPSDSSCVVYVLLKCIIHFLLNTVGSCDSWIVSL